MTKCESTSQPLLLIITQVLFNERDYLRFGLKIFIENGFCVEVWDCSAFLLIDMNKRHRPVGYIESAEYLHRPDSLYQFDKLLSRINVPDRFAICMIGFYPEADEIRKSLHSNNFKYADLKLNYVPQKPFNKTPLQPYNIPDEMIISVNHRPKVNLTFIMRLYKLIRQIVFYIYHVVRGISNKVFRIKSKQIDNHHAADFHLCGGLEGTYDGGSDTVLIRAHTMDYDRFLTCKVKPMQNHIVFLDEYLPFHPDFLFYGISTSSPEKYYPLLEKAFVSLEQKFRIPVIIAAHPRSDIAITQKWMPGRKIVPGQTTELIAQALLVCGHSSTSFNFAVLYRKPVALFNITSMAELNRRGVALLASHLGVRFYWLDEITPEFNDDILKVNENRYSQFQNQFIKEVGSPEKLLFQIVASAFYSSLKTRTALSKSKH